MRNGGSELAAAEPTRVLVVEDDEASRRAVVQCLREDGCIVFEAPDGLAGLDLAGRERIDLIVLDLMLPKLDGEHVLEKLRRTSAVAVIVVSAKREEDDRIAALELGADDYLTKPFTVRELRARMRAGSRPAFCPQQRLPPRARHLQMPQSLRRRPPRPRRLYRLPQRRLPKRRRSRRQRRPEPQTSSSSPR